MICAKNQDKALSSLLQCMYALDNHISPFKPLTLPLSAIFDKNTVHENLTFV